MPLTSESAIVPAAGTPGLAAILRGTSLMGQADPPPQAEPQPAPALPHQRKRLIQSSLILADVLLFGFAASLILKSHGHPGWLEIGLSALALVAGAWLTCLALLLD